MKRKNKKLNNSLEYCPHCKSNLQGDLIPKKDQHLFGATHFSRKIGFYDLVLDCTVGWICPDCQKRFDRCWD